MFTTKNTLTTLSLVVVLFFAACKKTTTEDKDTQTTDTPVPSATDTAVAVNMDSPMADEAILLRLQPEAGVVYIVENNSAFSSDETMDTMRIKATSTKWIKSKLVVKGMEEEAVKLEFTITDARKTVKDDSGTLSYRYGKAMSNPDDETNRKVEDCMVNSPLTLLITPRGESTDVRGYDEIIKKVKAIVGAQVPDQMIMANIGSPTDNLEYFFVNYPENPVKIGDTWSFDAPSVLQGVPILLATTYTLADRKDGVAFINFNTTVRVDKSQLPPEMAAEVDKIKFNAGIKGTGQIEEKTGFPLLMQINQFMEVNDTYQGITTSSKQTGSSTIKVVK